MEDGLAGYDGRGVLVGGGGRGVLVAGFREALVLFEDGRWRGLWFTVEHDVGYGAVGVDAAEGCEPGYKA